MTVDSLLAQFLKAQPYADLQNFGVRINRKPLPDDDFFISWGEPVKGCSYATMETGFFYEAMHVDATGLYESASFNFPAARREVENYSAEVPWPQLPLEKKFKQPSVKQKWGGVVIVLQHPNDRSVLRSGSTKDYHDFVEASARTFGKQALLKKHPVTLGNKDEMQVVEGIALKYGCEIVHADVDLAGAEFCFVYNSTFVVDALMARCPVRQFAPGYFWQSGAVDYTGRCMDTRVPKRDFAYADKLLDFLVWKYCFHYRTPLPKLAHLFKLFADRKTMFPLPEEFSYASHLLKR